ncbi:PAS domain S-box protein [Xanthobacter sp. V4C-4]|uniref:sensor domain-containing diguanylate cyclase n=1 Tax=Xanthobacter cornucopiae TaxID=3119924 RepID=UPI003726E165
MRQIRRDYERAPHELDTTASQTFAALPPSADARVAIYDADGGLVASNGRSAAPENVADTPYFKAQKARAGEDVLLLGEAERGVDDGRWWVPMVRPLAADGSGFGGVMVLRLAPAFLSDELALVVLGGHDTVGAVHVPNGTYLARSSDISTLMGRAVDASRPYLDADARPTGVFTAQATHEPIERIYGWARLQGFPVVVFVGLSTADLLDPLNQTIAAHRWTNLIGTGVLLCLGLGLAQFALRDVRQRARLVQQEALYHALFEQNHSVKLITDPANGHILAANAAAAAFYGYSQQALAGMNIAQINCLPREEIRRRMEEAKEGERPSFIFPHRLASGDIRMVEVFSGPVKLQDGIALYSIIHDVTDRFELERGLRESETRYRSIFEVVPAGLLLVNESGAIVECNSRAAEILRTDPQNVAERTRSVFDANGQEVPFAERPSVRCLTEDLDEELFFLRDASGRRACLSVNTRRFLQEHGTGPTGAVVAFSDITRAVQLEEEVLISERVFEAAAEGIMVTDRKWEVIRVNPAFQELTGYRADEVVGKRPRMLASGHNALGFCRPILKSLAVQNRWEGDMTSRRQDGRLFVERAVISAIMQSDGRISGYVALLSDITARKRQEEENWQRANFDPLTGLPNRTLLSDRIEQALAQHRRTDGLLGLLFIDLDRFKPINDKWGHAAGDQLLGMVAQRIAGAVRAGDTVARVGGDEFVVFLPALETEADAMTVAQKIHDRISAPFRLAEGLASISACVGVAVGRASSASTESLIRRADAAMYRGKTSGRSCVVAIGEMGEVEA